MRQLGAQVPERVRLFWQERVVEPYEARLYGLAFECSFRVVELAVLERSEQEGGPSSFYPAVQWLQKRGIVPRMGHPGFPGVELWLATTGARNHASHYASALMPMRTPQHMLDPVLATLAGMVEALWQDPSTAPTDGAGSH